MLSIAFYQSEDESSSSFARYRSLARIWENSCAQSWDSGIILSTQINTDTDRILCVYEHFIYADTKTALAK